MDRPPVADEHNAAPVWLTRRVEHCLERMRHWLREAEKSEAKYNAAVRRAEENPAANQDPFGAKFAWQKSPAAQDLLAGGVWAWRKAEGYAALLQAEVTAHGVLPTDRYAYPRGVHKTP